MIKNVVHPFSLLLLIIIIAFASCSSPKRYSKRSSKKTRVERKSRTTVSARNGTSKTISSQRSNIITTAKKYIGKQYTYGGKSPSSGFDCSGFTSHVFQNNGITLTGASHSQAKQGRRKSKRELEIGDLVFFGKNNKVSHVGIVADVKRSGIKVIHSTSSRGVVIDDITSSDYWQSRYLFGRDVLN